MLCPAVSEPVDSAQIAEYFKARSAERSPPPPPTLSPPQPSPSCSPANFSSDDLLISPEPDGHPLVARHVTFHVNAGDPETPSSGSSSASLVSTLELSSKPNGFLSNFAKRRPSVNRVVSESLDLSVPETAALPKPKRRLFNRSTTDTIICPVVASVPLVPSEDEGSSPTDLSMSPSPTRPPHVLRRSMKGIKEAIRRKPRPININPSRSRMMTDDDDCQGNLTEIDCTPTSRSSPQPNNGVDSTSKRPFLSHTSSIKICPNSKLTTTKPPLRTAYTYTFVSAEMPTNGEEVIMNPSLSSSIRRPSNPRRQSTYGGQRFASDPIPVFTPLAPSATSPSSAVAAARAEAYCLLEGSRPPRDRRKSTPLRTSPELSSKVRVERSSRSSLPPPMRQQDPMALLGLRGHSLCEKRHSAQ